MAIPDNYIDKITKEGDSRPICPAADKVRVDNENFEGADLDAVLDEVAEAIDDAGGGYNPPAGGIPKTDLAPGVQASLDKADLSASQAELATQIDNVITSTNLALQGKANAADVYDKETVDDMVAEAGKVKTVSVNGGTPAHPDTNGNVNLVVQAGAQGQKGDKGDTVVLDPQGLPQFTIVNDLVSGGEADALSAEMGRRLAMLSGTYAEAWAHAQAIPYIFPWLWVETVDGDAICKPIWHRGSNNFVDAAGSPISVVVTASAGDPTIGGTEGSTVPKDTVITITPASGCALHYSVDGGSTYKVADRAVNITLSTAGAKVIMAYCSNPNGSTTPVTRHITVAGTAVPTFAAKPNSGTTLTQKSGYVEVSRGGYVRISGAADGTLYYSTDGENYTEVQGNNYYDFQIANSSYETTAFVIYAKNKVGNDFSDPVTGTFKMAALAAPNLTPAGGEVASGSTVAITAPAGTIYYTTDGSDPDEHSTEYSTAIAITAQTTIKAIAKDSYGYSAVSSGNYSVAVPGIKVVATGATTMSLGDTGLKAIPIAAGTNKITIDDINTLAGTSYSSFADHAFASLSFGDTSKIVEFDGGGAMFNTLTNSFKNATNLEAVNVAIPDDAANPNGWATSAFDGAVCTGTVKVSGKIVNANQMFKSSTIALLDLADMEMPSNFFSQFLYYATITEWRVGGTFTFKERGSNWPMDQSHISVMRVMSTGGPVMDSYNWVASFFTNNQSATMYVPNSVLADYRTAAGSANENNVEGY